MLDNVLPGGWIVDGKLGEGSYGVVYRVKRNIGNQTEWAAIKHISIPANESELNAICAELGTEDEKELTEYLSTVKDTVLAEYHQMKQFQGHTNVVACNDIQIVEKEETVGYDLYIRMELLSSLSSRIVAGQMNRQETLRMSMDICRALTLLSSKGIVHRDIKPQNIFVNDNGDYKLGDFGTARSIQGTSTMMSMKGTFAYMPPEIMQGKPANFTTDIYSLGLVMYRLMNGNKAPFMQPGQSSTATSIEAANTRRFRGEELPLPSEADETLGKIICKACAFESWNRWQSAEEMYDALCDISSGTVRIGSVYIPPVSPPPAATLPKDPLPKNPPPKEPPQQPKKKKWWIAVFAAIIVLICIIGSNRSQPSVSVSAPTNGIVVTSTPKPTATPTKAPTATPTKVPTAAPPEWSSWSSWSTTKTTANSTTQVEQKTQYRSRAISKSQAYTDWGSWSTWSTEAVSENSTRDVETRTQYRYRDQVLVYSNWSSWSSWSESKKTISDSDLMQEEKATKAHWWAAQCRACGHHNPYHGANVKCKGCGKYLSKENYKAANYYSDDKTGSTLYGRSKGRTYNGKYYWYADMRTVYRYRTRTTSLEWKTWSDWSTTAIKETSTREVQVRTQYRYRTRSLETTTNKNGWSSWSDTKIKSSSTLEVDTRIVYRYRVLQGGSNNTSSGNAASSVSKKPTSTPPPTSSIPSSLLKVDYEYGMTDPVIQTIKKKMQSYGYYTKGSDVSSKYNEIMVERIEEFQKKNGLKVTGQIDYAFLEKLYSGNVVKTNTHD